MKAIKCYSPNWIVLTIWMCVFVSIQSKGEQGKQFHAVISGKIDKGLKQVHNNINVWVYEQGYYFPPREYNVWINPAGEFKITLQFPVKVTRFRLALKGDNQVFMDRIIEPDDEIMLSLDASISPAVANYYGESCVKYSLENKLKKEVEAFHQHRNAAMHQADIKEAEISGNFRKIHAFFLKGYLSFTSLLSAMESTLSKPALSYYRALYGTDYLATWNLILQYPFQNTLDQELRKNIQKSFATLQFPDYNLDQDNVSLCAEYLRFLVNKAQLEHYFRSQGKGFTFISIYNKLKADFSGILQQRLLTYFLTDKVYSSYMLYVNDYRQKDFDLAVKDALGLVRISALRQLLVGQSTMVRGVDAYPFSLPDTEGKMVSLKDFRGKVVLIDIWGTGCISCSEFFRRFEKDVMPKLSVDVDFVKVTINVDGTLDRFVTAVNSGKYTKKENVNLFTDGLGIKHPFLEYYQVQGLPFLFLIDKKGKIFASINGGMSTEVLLSLIKAALAGEDV